MKTNPVLYGVILLFGVLVGNHLGDQATLRNCATYGKAPMVGGGTVICTVEKKAEK